MSATKRIRKSWQHARYGAPLWATCYRCTGFGRVKVTDDGAFKDEYVEYRGGSEAPPGWTALDHEPVLDPYDPESHDIWAEMARRGVNGR